MPLVVEISVAFSILIAFIVIGIFLFPDSRALRFRGRLRPRRLPGRAAMNLAHFNPATAVLVIPIVAAALLAVLPATG